ncbi:hypothetical protein PRUPE_3G304700 [Prunus persica]|uniref:Uncharacterized protein n=1 Tax=Prunus persica TaxID=3760 RepID=A0A251Q7W0_PRUPE|nr:hypothetical protein PRUPE_3G304700 [Prunus persica]
MDNNNLVFFMFRQIGPAMFRNTQVSMSCVGGCGCLLHHQSHPIVICSLLFFFQIQIKDKVNELGSHSANSQILDLHVFPMVPDVSILQKQLYNML